MPTFKITGPDGKSYNVTGDTPEGALQALTTHLGAATPTDNRDTVLGSVDAFMRGAADAATFGFADEIAAGLGTGLGYLGDYDAELARQRGIDTSDEQNRPASRIGGQVGGALLTAAAVGPSRLAPFSAKIGTSAPMWQRVAAGSAEGLGAGAAYGYGSGEDGAANRAANVVPYAAMGGVAGAAAPVLSSGVGRGYEAVMDAIRSKPIAANVGASPEALRVIGSLADADLAKNGPGYANMLAAGPEAMLVDAGPSAAGMLDTAIQRGGPGARIASERVGQRVSRDTDALVSALDQYLGNPQGVTASQRSIRDAARPGVNQAYETAQAMPIDYASEAGRKVEDVINRIPARYKSQAIQRANERLAYDGKTNLQIMADIADDGSVSFREMPNVAQADAIKRALDEIANEGTDPLSGKMSSDALFATRMARDLRGAVSEAVPEYKTALATAADPLSRQSAVENGSKLLSPSMTRDQAEYLVKGLTPAEKDAMKQGVRSRIDDAMANVTRTAADDDVAAREALKAVKDLSSRASREKLTVLLGDKEAVALLDEVDRVAKSFNLKANVATNSRTYGRQAMSERVGELTAPGPATKLMRGEPLNASKMVAQSLSGETDQAMSARQDAIYAEIADILTRSGNSAPAVFDAIARMTSTDAATQQAKASIIRALSGPRVSYSTALTATPMLQRETGR